ncbi:MAG: hypothetical protein JSU91_01805 [Thermoplasmatales archaeon]|nr:MAG: hypothetical protein JSU91_01805 [Thermoplasmatales archaeon]
MSGFKIKEILVTDANNASANELMQDVIGNKDDIPGQSFSLVDYSKTGYYHVHSPAVTYPRAADGVTVTAGNTGAWSEGAKVEIIPANTITKPFDIHWALVSNVSAEDDYELRLYSGGVGEEVEISAVAFTRGASGLNANLQVRVQVPINAANSRISASLLCGDGDGATGIVKLYTHTYPTS